jgi:3-oxoacyl-[acyl-carrier protein] reductase
MDLGLEGRVALVLGAGGGLGGAIADALSREGAKLALADLNRSALDQAASLVRARGALVHAIEWDLSDLTVVNDRVASIEAALGGVDILINTTGGPPPSDIAGIEPLVWHHQFNAMVMSVVAITDRLLPCMRQRRWGRVLTNASSGVVVPIPQLGLSNALRSTLVGWSKTLAREVARDGVTVNIVIPGRIDTGRIRFLDRARAEREGRALESIEAESADTIPIGRYGLPEEYADVVTFLASDRASYVTGSLVRVDGGYISSI